MSLMVVGCEKSSNSNKQLRRPNVVLIVMDGLRADGLSLYGNMRLTSPTMDALAQHALVFDRAYSQSCWTPSSMASMMTGTYQSVHQVTHRYIDRYEFSVLDESFVTLAEMFRHAGYSTAAFLTQAWLLPKTGFAQGFDTFRTVSTITDLHETERVILHGIEWLSEHRQKPFFLYLHILNPHFPYQPPEPFDRLWWRDPPPEKLQRMRSWSIDRRWLFLIRQMRQGGGSEATPKELDYLRALYDSEIRYVDYWLGILVRRLEHWRLLNDTVIVLTSDHGESFKEHGWMGHGAHVFNENLHVPLVFSHPVLFPRQRRIGIPVQSIDIYATLAGIIGQKPSASVQGHDLRATELPGIAYSEGLSFNQFKLQTAGWSVHTNKAFDRWTLYNLKEDPGETRDRWQEEPELAREFKERLLEQYWLNLQHPQRVERRGVALDEKAIESLRSLGYIE